MSLGVALILLIIGLASAYWAITSGPAPEGAALRERWQELPLDNRMMAIAGFVASAWGLGVTIDNLARKAKE
jgi:hypothetical protein